MTAPPFRELVAFLAVAEAGSFTGAARRQGVTQSALSQSVRSLEDILGIPLFSRTTRSVSLTGAGERLLREVGPAVDEIATGLMRIGEMRDKPAGVVRISCDEFSFRSILWPATQKFIRLYPEISVELLVEDRMVNIVTSHYDAGVRRGGLIEKDMITTPIGDEIRMAVVGAPGYLQGRQSPDSPADLVQHECILLRPAADQLFDWRFDVEGQTQKIKVTGQLTFSLISSAIDAAKEGFGLAFVPEGWVRREIAVGELVEVLGSYSHTFERYHLYYPSRRKTPAFGLFVEALKSRVP